MSSKKPRKVAFISEIPTPYRVPLFEKISQETGVQPLFVFCSETQLDRQWSIKSSDELNKKVLKGWQFQRKGKNTLTTFFNPEVILTIFKGNFDFVVIAGWAQPTMIMAMIACWVKRVPYVLHSESHALKPRGVLKRVLRYLYPGFVIRQAQGYLVTGSRAAEYVTLLGGKRERIFVFPNTIDVDRYMQESQRLAKKKSYLRSELELPGQYNFLYVGRLVKVKGIEELVTAYAKLSQQLHEWGLVVIGDGPLKNRLTNDIRTRKLQDRILMVPHVDSAELIRYYTASDLFILPSHDEPWGVVVNEAMACGLPLILSQKVGAAADLLENHGNGFDFTAGDDASLAEKMYHIASDTELRKHMAKRSGEIITAWSYKRNLEAFRRLSQRIMHLPLTEMAETS